MQAPETNLPVHQEQPTFSAPPVVSSSSAVSGIDLRGLYSVLLRRWKLIIGVMVVVTALTTVILLLQTKLYTAEAVLQFDNQKSLTDLKSAMLNLPPDESAIKSEIDVVRSRFIAGRVIDKLALTSNAEFNPELQDPGLLDGVKGALKGLVEPDQKGEDAENAAKRRNRTLMIDGILKRLEAYVGPKSYTLYVRFTSESPEMASKITNAFADEYLNYQLEKKYEATRRATEWLNARLQNLRKKLADSETAVQAYREKHGLVNKDEKSVSDQQLNEISTQLILARSERAQAEARLARAQQLVGSAGGGESINEVLNSYLIQRLREQESQIMRERADLSTRYGPNHPQMIKVANELRDLQSKIGTETKKIIEGLRNEVVIARSREQSLQGSLDGIQGKVGQARGAEVQLAELERQQEANRTLYNAMLNRFKETSQAQDVQQVNVSIVSSAEAPLRASWPPRALFLVLSMFVGAVLGGALVFILEMLDNGFRTLDHLTRQTGVAGIGMVPMLKGKHIPFSYAVENPTSSYAESLRTVMTAVHFSNPDSPPKSLMVLSSIPKEGKSSFAMSLARLYAKSGHKVLLVDCDLRRPTVAKAFGEAPGSTLSDLITGSASLAEVIKVDKETGMHYITSASNTPNSQELLSSRKMQEFVEQMHDRYDLVVLDAPPVLALSDGIRLSKIVDTTLYLVRWEKTPRNVVMNAMRQINQHNVKLAGIVLSRVDLEKHRQYNYGDNAYIYTAYKDYYSS